ncbi:MAG: hypothetical protein GTO64_01060 [Candidatus Latescibacteria bacterium]|nr:hypothetical protein [Candidatus Latescibacterota bacterium]NIT00966.1 hypothetical protein [Candidatus Latescibacterota bacterium]
MFAVGGDHLEYIDMARSPAEAHSPPYCYRLLVPAIARLLPFDLAVSFYMLTLLFITGAGILLYYLLGEMGENGFYSLIGVCLFYSLNWGVKFAVFDFWLTDPALYFFSVLYLLLLIKGKGTGASLSLCFAVLSKEAALFLIPLAYTLKARRFFDTRALLRMFAIGAAPVALFLVLRFAVHSTTAYNPISLWSDIGIRRLTSDLVGYVRGGTVGTWGILVLALPFFSGREGWGIALRSLPFLALVYMQPFFAVNVDRLLVFAFPVVVPLAVKGLRRIARKLELSRWMVVGYALIPLVLILIKSGYQSPSPEMRLLALAIWSLPVVAAKYFGQRGEDSDSPVSWGD